MAEINVVTDLRRLADHDAHAVVDDEAAADAGGRNSNAAINALRKGRSRCGWPTRYGWSAMPMTSGPGASGPGISGAIT